MRATPSQQTPNRRPRETQKPPEISFNGADTGKFIVVALDLDAPYKAAPVISSLCHWIQADLQPSGSDNNLTSPTPPVVDYIGANPAPFSMAPHRYVFMLFKQPDGFDASKLECAYKEGESYPMTWRMRFDLEGFVKDAGLGEWVAANYFVSL